MRRNPLADFAPSAVAPPRTRGDAALAAADYKAALAEYNQAIEHAADDAAAYVGCGRALTALAQHEFALAHLAHAVQLAPGDPAAHYYHGVALQKVRRYEDALTSFQRAADLKPDDMAAYLGIANTLSEMDRHEEALAFYDGVIAQSPNFALAHNNRGNLLLDCLRIPEALASYETAARLDPHEMKFSWNRALMELLLGNFTAGWQQYECGFKTEGFARGVRRVCPQPEWLGADDIRGKRVLLYAEQGYGDTLQFARYALLVAARGAHVILEVQPPLVALLQTLPGDIEVVPQGSAYRDFDYHCPLMSLPMVFGTTVDTVPAPIPYLRAERVPVKAGGREAAFQRPPGRLQVGLAWSGATTHNNDHRRSLLLAQLAPLLALSAGLPVDFTCLQKEIRPQDEAALAALPQLALHMQDLHDFADTAALVANMDLVISVDTSVAHLAGALGKPLWLLLPFVPDYRWLLDRDDTPWYPGARLFRQPRTGDWASVIDGLVAALRRQTPTLLTADPDKS